MTRRSAPRPEVTRRLAPFQLPNPLATILSVQSLGGSEVLITFSEPIGFNDVYDAITTFSVAGETFDSFAGMTSETLDVILTGSVGPGDGWSWPSIPSGSSPEIAVPAAGLVIA